MKNHTSQTLNEIRKIVTPNLCKKLSIQTKFVKRCTSRLNGYEFINAMILGGEDDSLTTYNRRILEFNPKAKLSSSALCQRINTKHAEELMLNIFINCLKSKYEQLNINNIPNISRILIQDSTNIPLNAKLAALYKGSGGHKKTAGVKIDCIYDYTNENILHLKQTSRTTNDVLNAPEIYKFLKENDLIIRDLGYFKIGEFVKIEESNAYYTSRLKSDVKIYLNESDKKALSISEFLAKKLKNRNYLNEEIYIGANKFKTKIIIYKLPDDIVKEKLRKANRDAKVRRRALTKEKKALLSYTILITNIPETIVSMDKILQFYKIRWSIELRFKEWKSQIGIKGIEGSNIHRIRCLIYGRLCLLLLLNKYLSYLSHRCLEVYEMEISRKRALDYLIKDGGLVEFFQGKISRFIELENNLFIFKKNKRKRNTTRESLLNALNAE